MNGPQNSDMIRFSDMLSEAKTDTSPEGIYVAGLRRKLLFIIIISIALICVAIISLGIGAVNIPVSDTVSAIAHALLPSHFAGPENEWYSTILFQGRLPRIVLAITTGASLAIAGSVMQGTLRNPLVSPFTLGVSSAASFGAAMSIVYGSSVFGALYFTQTTIGDYSLSFSTISTMIFSFITGMASIVLVLILGRRKDTSKSTIILGGVVVGYLFQAGVTFTKYISNDEALRDITLWLMGGTWNASWGSMIVLVPVVLITIVLLEGMSFKINTLSAGDDVASNLGVDVNKLRRDSLILSTFITSVCISFTGIIGFIGLMAPHICRMFIGNDSRYLFPASAVMGSLILLSSDTISRVIIAPSQLPVGIIMYIIGGIFFIWLISRKNVGEYW